MIGVLFEYDFELCVSRLLPKENVYLDFNILSVGVYPTNKIGLYKNVERMRSFNNFTMCLN